MRYLFFLLLFSLTALATSAQSRRRSAMMPQATGPVPVVSAPQPHLLESIAFGSSLLNRPVRYSIILPDDYYTSNRRYPVVYLLHGFGDDETGWIQFGEADRILTEGIRAGALPPMILVMPDGGKTWYINDYQNKVRYEDMFVQEFIPHIDSTYRTRHNREFRAIAGVSMGGHGALMLAMHHPDLFGSCVGMSAAVRSEETFMAIPDDRYNTAYANAFSGPVTGEERLTTTWKRSSPLVLARSAPENDLKQVRWMIDCGDDDPLTIGNAMLHMALLNRKITHEFRIHDGGHTWLYWRTGLPDALKFMSDSFH